MSRNGQHCFTPTEQQRLAIEHVHGPMLVVAGAGTGKTTVLSRRIAHLINTGEAKPDEILAVTYTRNGAAELAVEPAAFFTTILTRNARRPSCSPPVCRPTPFTRTASRCCTRRESSSPCSTIRTCSFCCAAALASCALSTSSRPPILASF